MRNSECSVGVSSADGAFELHSSRGRLGTIFRWQQAVCPFWRWRTGCCCYRRAPGAIAGQDGGCRQQRFSWWWTSSQEQWSKKQSRPHRKAGPQRSWEGKGPNGPSKPPKAKRHCSVVTSCFSCAPKLLPLTWSRGPLFGGHFHRHLGTCPCQQEHVYVWVGAEEGSCRKV